MAYLQRTIEGFEEDLVDADLRKQVETMLSRRWEYLHASVHSMDYMLDPEFTSYDHLDVPELLGDFQSVAKALLGYAEKVAEALIEYKQDYKPMDVGILEEGTNGEQLARKLPGFHWWDLCGRQMPELCKLAKKVLT
jgi:hypothetical protein